VLWLVLELQQMKNQRRKIRLQAVALAVSQTLELLDDVFDVKSAQLTLEDAAA
jgi:hypothetical protein